MATGDIIAAGNKYGKASRNAATHEHRRISHRGSETWSGKSLPYCHYQEVFYDDERENEAYFVDVYGISIAVIAM